MKRILESQEKEREMMEKEQRREKGERSYQVWLEESVKKMQQERGKKIAEKEQKMAEEAEKLRKLELKKARAERSYQEWLRIKNEEKRRSEIFRREEEKQHAQVIRPFNKADYDVQKILKEELGEQRRTKKRRHRRMKRNGKGRKTMEPKQFEEVAEEAKTDGENVMEKIRQPEVHSKMKQKEINTIVEEHGKEQSKSSEPGNPDTGKMKLVDHKGEVEAKVAKAVQGKKRKGKKHDPPADQMFEELSSIQRNSQHAIEGENSVESGILNIDKDNPAKNKPNTSI